ncbi:MAG: hypothetical protein PHS41_07275 [Victivallaceae bacterium]|nr:hypothetical protein [Victivallaceae bacterium]
MWAQDKFRPDPTGAQVVFNKHMAKDHCNSKFVSKAIDALAARWNVPFLIGELQLEPKLQSAETLQELLQLLTNNAHQYGVLFWRPHPDQVIFADIWSSWALQYASPVPFPAKPLPMQWIVPKQNQVWNWKSKDPVPCGFVLRKSAFALPDSCKQYEYRIVPLGQTFPAGAYTFEFVTDQCSDGKGLTGVYLFGQDGSHTFLRSFNGNSEKIVLRRFVEKPFSGLVVKKIQSSNSECPGFNSLCVSPQKLLVEAKDGEKRP